MRPPLLCPTTRSYKTGPTPRLQFLRRRDAGQAYCVCSYLGQSLGSTFTDTSLVANVPKTTPRLTPQFQDPFSPGQIESVVVTGEWGVCGHLHGGPLRLQRRGGSGAAGYGVVDPQSTDIIAVSIDDQLRDRLHDPAPPQSRAQGGATFTVTLGQLSGTYPTPWSHTSNSGGPSARPTTSPNPSWPPSRGSTTTSIPPPPPPPATPSPRP